MSDCRFRNISIVFLFGYKFLASARTLKFVCDMYRDMTCNIQYNLFFNIRNVCSSLNNVYILSEKLVNRSSMDISCFALDII